MKIESLRIENFKAVRHISLRCLGDVVVVAGPNGCGKSCVLDAIRFLKSTYTRYRQRDEWHHFFNEFQVNMNSDDEIRRLFYDRERPIIISADFSLANAEVEYLRYNVQTIIRKMLLGQSNARNTGGMSTLIEGDLTKNKIDHFVLEQSERLLAELDHTHHTACLTLDTTAQLSTSPSAILEVVFSIYEPEHLGVFDYHSANRTYQRERIGGINVNIEETSERLAQHALFNWQNKYTNIK
jgi:predicted ATP-dependent endonuclease of OLD family